MIMPLPRRRFPPGAAGLVLLASTLLAQTSPKPAPATTSSAAASNDQPVTLSEFNVTAKPLSEYAAAESTTGTRIVSTIRDLPFNVNVVTGELLDDFQALDFRDQMA